MLILPIVHSVHRSEKIRKLAEYYEEKLKLFYLPPYSPELNPDKPVCNDLLISAYNGAVVH
jgi:transposase